MSKLNKNEKGFSVVELLLVVLVLVLIVVIGWMVYKNHHKTSKVGTTSSVTKTPVAKSLPATTITPGPSSDLYTYTNNSLGFSFNFPKTIAANVDCTKATTVSNNYGKPVTAPSYYQTSLDSIGTTVVSNADQFYVTSTTIAEVSDDLNTTIDGNSWQLPQVCAKVPVTADLATKYLNQRTNTPTFAEVSALPFNAAIVKQGAQLNTEVEKIFDDPSLVVTSVSKATDGNWSNLSFTCNTVNNPMEGCAQTGGSYTLQYYPSTNLLIYWATGQACKLAGDSSQSTCYDHQIISSLKLIN